MAGHPPTGTVTFLLTDLEGSTRLWEQDPEAMKAAMARHDALLEEAIADRNGFTFARMGDGMAAAFGSARDGVLAAAGFQRALADEPWDTPGPLRARIGLHTDEGVVVNDNNYASPPINRCSRLMSAAHGGQVVISGSTEMLVREQLPEGMGLLDLGEHRLRDLGSPVRAFQLFSDNAPEDFPPLRSMDTFPGKLPAQVSSFIGREAEVARVARALGESRVVTITGVGGVGKTRLALQVAADLLPRYRDGAWLVELAPVHDPEDVVEAVAGVFHLTSYGGRSLDDTLVDALERKRLLLLLDNCEHVLGVVAELVTRLERACPGLVVLATSREGMAIDGEQLIALPPLQAGKAGDDIDRLLRTDAVNLFVERARHVKADFVLTKDNSRPVVEICQRLDGVPLAIELAAARVIALNPAELARRLDRRFQVLAGGRRAAFARHATLRAAIDWSYELLSPAQQRLLARLAVFSVGCDLEAIEEICSGGPVDPDAVIDLIAALVARSLVIAEDHSLGTRYRLLETIRQYGEERLTECGETEMLLNRHARFYAALSAHAAECAYGPEHLAWAKKVNLERDNIRAALVNAIDAGDSPLAVQLVANHPHRQSANANPIGEVFSVPAPRVLDLPCAAEQPDYPRVLIVAAYHARDSGDDDNVDALCRRALEAERRLSSPIHGPPIEMDVCTLQAEAALSAGAFADAVTAYIRAAELAGVRGYSGPAAIYLAYCVNAMLLGVGGIPEAATTAERSVALARQSGMPGAIAISLNALAVTSVEHDPERARSLLQESVQCSSNPGEEIAPAFITASMVAGRLHDSRLTLALAGRSLSMYRWIMNPMQSAPCLAECARALADELPEVAGVLEGAAYAGFRRAPRATDSTRGSETAPGDPTTNILFTALNETGELVAAALGDQRRRELRAMGAAMSTDEAVSYALANIDPKLLTGPIALA